MNTKLWSAVIIPMLLLSGCLGSSAEPTPTVEPEMDTFEMIWGHQFNGSYPTSIANLTDFKLNETSNIKFDTWSRFHEPTDGERGYGNISLYGPDNYTWYWNTQESKRVVLEVDLTQSGNYTLRIHTSGSNNDTENYPGDAMVVVTEVSTWN
ncbi:MAG: hypothetical protein CMA72_04715 [Euryarchaeota archaeon]|jgi:hypothetical protein|nr:hypothetical protein [Euryarchaeota archaeon]|tara:strand:- start:1924 stop:2379 length:456 start_codon:yes stop_codon:yes gene_type:complete